MRQPPGESDMAVSDALLPSFSTFASGPAGREKTLRPAGAPNNRWREELSHMKRLPPVLPGRPYDLAAATVAPDLEGGGVGAACGGSNPALLPRRETEEFNDLLDLDFILSNSLSHPESVAATVSSSASASSSSSPSSSGAASAPSTCSFSYPIRAGGDPGVAPPQAVLAKPKLWSLAEIATSSDKVKDGGGGSEGSPCPPCPGPVAGQALGGSRASPAPAPARSPSAQCPFPGGTVLSRPLYYTAPFYPGYTNYGSFGHLHGHPGPGPGPTTGPGSHFNGLNQTVLNRADALAKDPKMLRSQSQLDLCKDSPYELKKDGGGSISLGPRLRTMWSREPC